METLEFYKSIFDKEQYRRTELNNAVNQPVTLVTILSGLLYFLFDTADLKGYTPLNFIILHLFIIGFFFFLISIYYLSLSFNNLLKGFDYLDFPKTKELYDYFHNLEKEGNNPTEPPQIPFDKYLIKKYVTYADNYVEINDKRSLYLHKAKKFIILVLAAEIITLILILVKNNQNVFK